MKKLTQEHVYQKIKEKEITLISKYKNTRTKVSVKCDVCGYEWNTQTNVLLNTKCGCPNCFGNAKKTTTTFISELEKINPNITILGEYINNKSPILCKCKIDQNQWESTPNNLLSGEGCPVCKAKKVGDCHRLSHNEFITKLLLINQKVIVLDTYKGRHKYIKCTCKKCNNMWETTPDSLLQGTGCPKCRQSKGEDAIRKYLDKLNVSYISQMKFNNLYGVGNKKLSYDFYIPYQKLLIEFQGKQHDVQIDHFGGEKQFKIQQEHDRRKREYAKNHNMDLLEIWYWDIENIKEILKNYIKSEVKQ